MYIHVFFETNTIVGKDTHASFREYSKEAWQMIL